MEDLNEFAKDVVRGWDHRIRRENYSRHNKLEISKSEHEGAINYVVDLINNMEMGYKSVILNNDNCPVSILSVTERGIYNHFMLLKVISSEKAGSLKIAAIEDWEICRRFSKYLKNKLFSEFISNEDAWKTIVFSTGSAFVLEPIISEGKYMLVDAEMKYYYASNLNKANLFSLLNKISEAHKLKNIYY